MFWLLVLIASFVMYTMQIKKIYIFKKKKKKKAGKQINISVEQ